MRRISSALLLLLVVGIGSPVLFSSMEGSTAAAAPAVARTAATSCDAGSQPAIAYFEVDARESAVSPQLSLINSVEVTDLPATCDGATAVLTVFGNAAGNGATPSQLLSTADSAVDPCSQKVLSVPVTVADGSITLPFCSTTGPAKAPSVHEVTALSLSVNGSVIPVTTTPVPRTRTPPATTSAGGKGSTTGNGGQSTKGAGGKGPTTGSGHTGGSVGSGSTRRIGGTTSTGTATGNAGALALGNPSTPPGGHHHRTTSPASGAAHGSLMAANLAFDWWPLLLVLLLLLLLGFALFLTLWRRGERQPGGEEVGPPSTS